VSIAADFQSDTPVQEVDTAADIAADMAVDTAADTVVDVLRIEVADTAVPELAELVPVAIQVAAAGYKFVPAPEAEPQRPVAMPQAVPGQKTVQAQAA